jgi:2-succinyl-6-hydroxy-2,4-cyclohexadiene-1-carboxylate synthase
VTAGGGSLVLLHGFAQTPASWQTTIECIGAGVDVAMPELPGHGATGLALGAPTPQLARRVVLDAIATTGRPAVVWGYSLGARVAFDLALNAPETVGALVIESGAPGIADPIARADRRSRDEALSRRIEAGTIEQFVSVWEQVPALGSPPPEVVESQRADRLRNDPEALAAALRGIGPAAYEPMWDRLWSIAQPVLLITGERDAAYTGHARMMLGLLPAASHVVVPGASHSVHIENPQAAAAAVTAFLGTLR